MTGHVMEGLLKLSFTPAEFTVWMRDVVKPKMQWQPQGCVLHNTGTMVWPGFDARGHMITPAQRMENMSVNWDARGFTSAPHVVISPDGMVNVPWPPWLHGTHSPSWNATHFGIELVGDFDREAFPDKMRESALDRHGGNGHQLPFPQRGSSHQPQELPG
jgi:N-acetylmuramoyl-L-alanine amidase